MSIALANLNEMQRQASKKDLILASLQAAGWRGRTNRELNDIAFRYGARVEELRKAGHDIESINEGDGRWRFILHVPARLKPGQPGWLASLPTVDAPPRDIPAATGKLF